ncbi:M12 family metallo-peptidase [Salibacteraceae bacterium]|nr:M12 family metallo-peptidase [Salibacteraceae bacterium]
MKHFFTLSIAIISSLGSMAQNSIMVANSQIKTDYKSFVYDLDEVAFRSVLASAPLENASYKSEGIEISIPFPDGSMKNARVVESPIIAKELSEKYPEIRTYKVIGSGFTGRIGLTYKGFHGILFSTEGTVYIDPIEGQEGTYHAYDRKDYMAFYAHSKGHECLVKDEYTEMQEVIPHIKEMGNRTGEQLRTYRLALACTGEYAQFHGGTIPGVLSAMVVSMNRVNGVYEKDFSITMEIIGNNDQLIFLNGNTDPYSNNDGFAMLNQNQSTVTSIIGSSNYDIGHVFSTGGGGVAALGSVCGGSKARGVTGGGSPTGDPFDIDYVAHEMGHQFGGNHTQNNDCNRVQSAAYEPGSASTIMGYAGICAPNLQSNSDDYFHAGSYNEVVAFSQFGNGNSCATTTNTGNTPPAVTVTNEVYTIPRETPFVLRGSATDTDGDNISYCWEEMDLGPTGDPDNPSGNAPIFRSFDPLGIGERTFPGLISIIGNTTVVGETYPTYSRGLTFRLTARDNNIAGGGVDFDEVDMQVDGSKGPFLVTTPAANEQVEAGTFYTVTWDVAQTDQAPINCQTVNIYLCISSGLTITDTLAEGVPNNGSYTLQMPNVNGAGRRIRVEAADNVFFNLNPGVFQIVSPTAIEGATINLNLTPDFANSSLNLDWNDDIPNESNWHVERSDNTTGNFTLIATLPGNTTSYSDASVSMNGTPYFYRVYASNGAGNSAFSNEVTYSGVGISELAALNIKVYPNPASGVLFLQLDNGIIASEAKIFNSQSQLMKSFILKSSTDQLNISDLASGFYFLSVQTDKGAVTIPFQAID